MIRVIGLTAFDDSVAHAQVQVRAAGPDDRADSQKCRQARKIIARPRKCRVRGDPNNFKVP